MVAGPILPAVAPEELWSAERDALPDAYATAERSPYEADLQLATTATGTAAFEGVLARFDARTADEKHLSPAQARRVTELAGRYRGVFDTRLRREPIRTPVVPHLEVGEGATPFFRAYGRYTPRQVEWLRPYLDQLEGADIVARCDAGKTYRFVSHGTTVPKGENDQRLVVDLRELNQRLVRLAAPVLDLRRHLAQLYGAQYFGTFDETQSFFQVVMTADSGPLTAFNTPFGVYYFKRLPMGLADSPAWLARVLDEVFTGLVLCQYVDDTLLFGRTFEEYYGRLEAFLARCQERNVVIKDSAVLCARHVTYCGLDLTPEGWRKTFRGIGPSAERPLGTAADLTGAVGIMTFLAPSVPLLPLIIEPLRVALAAIIRDAGSAHRDRLRRVVLAESPFWSAQLADVVVTAWDAVQASLRLAFPAEGEPYFIFCDASKRCWAWVLAQAPGDSMDEPALSRRYRVVAIGSGVFRGSERGWTTTERELEAICKAVSANHHLLVAAPAVHVYSDHANLRYMFSDPARVTAKKVSIERIGRRIAELAAFPLHVYYLKGVVNTFVDYLSRPPGEEEEDEEDEGDAGGEAGDGEAEEAPRPVSVAPVSAAPAATPPVASTVSAPQFLPPSPQAFAEACAEPAVYEEAVDAGSTAAANGVVERGGGLVLQSIAATLFDQGKADRDWTDVLPLALLACNNAPSARLLGRAPITVFTGRPALAVSDVLERLTQDPAAPRKRQLTPDEVAAIGLQLETAFQSLTPDVVRHQVARRTAEHARYARRGRVRELKLNVGDLVLVSHVALPPQAGRNKLSAKWLGPAMVTDRVHDKVYRVRFLGADKTQDAATDHLQLLHEGSLPGSPGLQAAADQTLVGKFVVEKLLTLRKLEDGQFYIRVRWVGYSDAECTWEPLLRLYDDVPDLVLDFVAHAQLGKDRRSEVEARLAASATRHGSTACRRSTARSDQAAAAVAERAG